MHFFCIFVFVFAFLCLHKLKQRVGHIPESRYECIGILCHCSSRDKASACFGPLEFVGMDGMMGTDEDSVFEPQLEEDDEEEDEDEGETYFRTEHVSRTEELQEEVDLAGKVKFDPLHHCTKCCVANSGFCRKCPFSVNFWV